MDIELRNLESTGVFLPKNENSIWLGFKETLAQVNGPCSSQEDLKLRELCRLFYFFSFPDEIGLPPAHLELRQLSLLDSGHQVVVRPRFLPELEAI